MRKRLLTGKKAEKIILLTAAFLGPPSGAHGNTQPALTSSITTPPPRPGQPFDSRHPYWGHELLPLRTHAAIRKKWNLRTTTTMIEQRRANLLGNLIRNNSKPRDDITQNQRADWWKSCLATTTTMKVTLEDAHNISFWKKSTRIIP